MTRAPRPQPPLLIVNGDDFGLTPGVTRGIVDAYRQGILRSTTMLAVAPAFDLAAAMATSGDCDGLGIGAHLALVGEDPPLLSPSEIPTLVDRRGNFPRSWRQFLARAAAGRIDRSDVRRELSTQLDRLEGVGVPLTHVDTHQHLHLWPMVRGVVLDLARDRGIPAMRATLSTGDGLVGKGVGFLSSRLHRAAATVGVSHPAAFAGLDESGQLDEVRLQAAITRLAAQGVPSAEIGCHPGRSDDPDRRRYRWGFTWPTELRALCAPEIREAVDRSGFRLGSFADLVPLGA